ncbi:Flp pilus assembly protein CpaB [Anaerolinea thermolimosa]|uniref:Flp pilus assembly protein CpaB n=1 Tax=Anaerolinea thermolimosa TaxID=229919 RepID=UPI000782AD6C|nr:Flp pilus assembly protein CpaB [Anaerolinea thermolimosa]GAP06999.1 Flp pilus assembly protein CpaB [Anaerolinea thermolimosa]
MAAGGRRRGRVFILIALILILLLVLVWAVMRLMSPTQLSSGIQEPVAQPTPVEEMVTIVISVQPIARGAEFTDAVVTTLPYPKKDLVEGAFITDINEVLGKRARFNLEARTPITSSMIVDPTMKNSPAAFQIPPGMVAIPIPVSQLSSVAYGLEPGDHVNVIASLLLVDIDPGFQSKLPNNIGVVEAPGAVEGGPTKSSSTITKTDGMAGRTELDPTLGQPVYVIPSEPQRPRLVSQTLIQDAIVLQTGNFPQPGETVLQPGQAAPTPVPGQEAQQQTTPKLPDTVTLIVTPQDAVTLNYLILAGGKLNLVMRSAGDSQRIATEPVTLQFILDQYNIPNPAKLPYGLEPRLDSIPSTVSPFPSTSSSGQQQVPPQ